MKLIETIVFLEALGLVNTPSLAKLEQSIVQALGHLGHDFREICDLLDERMKRARQVLSESETIATVHNQLTQELVQIRGLETMPHAPCLAWLANRHLARKPFTNTEYDQYEQLIQQELIQIKDWSERLSQGLVTFPPAPEVNRIDPPAIEREPSAVPPVSPSFQRAPSAVPAMSQPAIEPPAVSPLNPPAPSAELPINPPAIDNEFSLVPPVSPSAIREESFDIPAVSPSAIGREPSAIQREPSVIPPTNPTALRRDPPAIPPISPSAIERERSAVPSSRREPPAVPPISPSAVQREPSAVPPISPSAVQGGSTAVCPPAPEVPRRNPPAVLLPPVSTVPEKEHSKIHQFFSRLHHHGKHHHQGKLQQVNEVIDPLTNQQINDYKVGPRF